MCYEYDACCLADCHLPFSHGSSLSWSSSKMIVKLEFFSTYTINGISIFYNI
jgi:hypothetical protein